MDIFILCVIGIKIGNVRTMQEINRNPTFVLTTVHQGKLKQVMEQLKSIPEVEVVAPVSGRFDLVLRVNAEKEEHVYELAQKIKAMQGMRTTNTHAAFEGFSNGQNPVKNEAWAYTVLSINRPLPEVLRNLKNVSGICEAYGTIGDFDVIVSLTGNTYQDIFKCVIDEIGKVEGISTSETFFAYEPLVTA